MGTVSLHFNTGVGDFGTRVGWVVSNPNSLIYTALESPPRPPEVSPN